MYVCLKDSIRFGLKQNWVENEAALKLTLLILSTHLSKAS